MTAVAEARLVGPWMLGERLGGGGQATVHRARHAESGVPAAVKLFHRAVWTDRAFRVRFRRECDALTALDHPNVVPILDCGEDDGRGYLAMGLAAEGSLAERIARGPVRPEQALVILGGVASALDAAHSAGLLHRDVTPGNILLDREGPWLADFGIARRLDATFLTAEDQLIGTAGYLAPEVIAGARAVPASDRYALAAVAFEALTGRPVFAADGVGGMLYAHAHRTPPRPSRLVPALPRALDDAMERALAKDPRDRPASATALVASLERALGLDLAGATRRLTRVQAPPRRRRRRRRRILVPALATLAGLATLGGGALALTSALTEETPAPAPARVASAPPPLTVPDGDGREMAGAPVRAGDLPGDAIAPGALAADADDEAVRVVAIRGGWPVLRSSRARLRAVGFTTRPLIIGGRAAGLVAWRPDITDTTGQSPRWAMLVVLGPAGPRALVVQGRHDAPAEYAARLDRASAAAFVPVS